MLFIVLTTVAVQLYIDFVLPSTFKASQSPPAMITGYTEC